jgi:hypothetical protein
MCQGQGLGLFQLDVTREGVHVFDNLFSLKNISLLSRNTDETIKLDDRSTNSKDDKFKV